MHIVKVQNLMQRLPQSLIYLKHQSVKKNLAYVAEFGRFDDLLTLVGTPCEKEMFSYLREQFDADMRFLKNNESVSLLAKWLPSVTASNADTVKTAKLFAKKFGLSEADYRKAVSALRAKIKIIENNLREKDYSFDYEKQPSRAMFKYKRAFARNDAERYYEFLSKVTRGEATLHADNVAPYELVEPYLYTGWGWQDKCFMKSISAEEKQILNATWESLPDFGSNENAIAVIDTSGSMYCEAKPIPAAVALSLGLYFAEHGYKLPQIIFWNVASRNRQQPVKQNEQGVALISGATPRIFEMVAGGKLSPYTFMLEILEKERYAKIAA